MTERYCRRSPGLRPPGRSGRRRPAGEWVRWSSGSSGAELTESLSGDCEDSGVSLLDLDEVCRGVLAAPAVSGLRLVGIDGPSGSGKSTLARRLRTRLPGSGLVEIDDFLSWADPAWWWPRFEAEVLQPLVEGRAAGYRVRDWSGDEFGTALGDWKVQPWASVVLLEGVGCTRREASPYLAYAIWVDASSELRLTRGLDRDGDDHLDVWHRWMTWEQRFVTKDGARDRADLRVDGNPAVPHDPETQLVAEEPNPDRPASPPRESQTGAA